MWSAIASDVRFGVRLYRRSPRFYGLLLAVLVLGIGSTTAMYGILASVLWRPLPFAEPDRLVMVWGTGPEGGRRPISLAEHQGWRARASAVQPIAVAHAWLFALSASDAVPSGVVGAVVSGEYFPMLGVEPLLGRPLGPGDDRAGAEPAVVIGAELWRSRFRGDAAVIGRSVLLDARPYTVVGVAPDGFDFSFPGNERASLWTARASMPTYQAVGAQREWYAMARLAPGVSREAAQAELTALAASAVPELAAQPARVELQPLHEAVIGDVAASVWLRFGAVGLAFLVACANVSNLLLVRTQARRSELAARAALGATRGRLVQQLMTETLVLFLLAVPLSALTANWLAELFVSLTLAPQSALRDSILDFDAGVWAVCLLTCLGAGLVAGVLPARVASRVDLVGELKGGGAGRRGRGAHSGVRAALVVAQVALAFALLTAGGLALRRVNQLLGTPLGYEPAGVIDLRLIGLPLNESSAEQQRATLERVLQRVATLPHVEAVAANGTVPLTGYDGVTDIEVDGRSGRVPVARNTITPGYLELMHIPLMRGRSLSAGDEPGKMPAVLISESLANALFPGQDPLGRRIRHAHLDSDFLTIVGVVGDLRRAGPGGAYSFETYAPLVESGVVVIRTDAPDRVRRELPAAVASVEPTLGTWVRTLPERVRSSAWDSIRISILLGAFAAIALVLSAVGLYAMVSYTTLLETRELGIRLALGAPPRAVVWLVMRRGLCWLGIGGALGLLAALALGQSLAARMPGARSFDLGVYLIVGAALLGAGSVAAFLPARRAVRASPALSSRYE